MSEKVTLTLKPGTLELLRSLAVEKGIVRGQSGNVSALLDSIAKSYRYRRHRSR